MEKIKIENQTNQITEENNTLRLENGNFRDRINMLKKYVPAEQPASDPSELGALHQQQKSVKNDEVQFLLWMLVCRVPLRQEDELTLLIVSTHSIIAGACQQWT